MLGRSGWCYHLSPQLYGLTSAWWRRLCAVGSSLPASRRSRENTSKSCGVKCSETGEVCSVHWSIVTLRGQAASEAYRKEAAAREKLREDQQPSGVPGGFWLPRSVCWHSHSIDFFINPLSKCFSLPHSTDIRPAAAPSPPPTPRLPHLLPQPLLHCTSFWFSCSTLWSNVI